MHTPAHSKSRDGTGHCQSGGTDLGFAGDWHAPRATGSLASTVTCVSLGRAKTDSCVGPRLEQRGDRWPHPTVGVAGILRPGPGMKKVASPCSDGSLSSVVLAWSLLPREASAGGWDSD